MVVRAKIEGDMLDICFSEIQDAERGRLVNIELELLKAYGSHSSMPWIPGSTGWTYQILRGDSNHQIFNQVKEVLRQFQLELTPSTPV